MNSLNNTQSRIVDESVDEYLFVGNKIKKISDYQSFKSNGNGNCKLRKLSSWKWENMYISDVLFSEHE